MEFELHKVELSDNGNILESFILAIDLYKYLQSGDQLILWVLHTLVSYSQQNHAMLHQRSESVIRQQLESSSLTCGHYISGHI